MTFDSVPMADPVVASDGLTYEREFIEDWMKGHNVSPNGNQPFEHKLLIPNVNIRKLIAGWCEQNGVPVPQPPKQAADQAAVGGGAAAEPLLHKPIVMCPRHSKQKLCVFCMDCNHGVCVFCAVDTDLCKAHTTEAFHPLMEELKKDREGWARAQRECDEGAEQLCADIQAEGDIKVRVYTQATAAQVVQLQQQVRSAAAARSTAMGAILRKREEREELVVAAAASADVAVKGSAAAAVVASALHRARAPIPLACAAEFRAAAAPAAAVGQVLVAAAVVDPEDEATRAAAAAATVAAAETDAAAAAAAAAAVAAVAALGPLGGSTLLQRVADRNKAQQFVALVSTKLPSKRYRLMYTWSRDGRSNASFHERCDNQVRAIAKAFSVHLLTLQGRGPRWSSCAPRMDLPSAATQLQHGTMVRVVTFQLQAASCFGLKPHKVARLDTSTVWPRRRHCMVDITARLVQSSMAVVIVCACATAITQQRPILNPAPDTPTPPGWVPPSSLALQHLPPRTTRCGLPRDAPPPPHQRVSSGAFRHTHLLVTNNKETKNSACAASSPIYVWRIIKRWRRRMRRRRRQQQQQLYRGGHSPNHEQ